MKWKKIYEKIKNVLEKLQNYEIRLLFKGNKLHIGLNGSDDTFEISELEEISEEKLKTTMESDIKWIIDFIDELDLTNDLFKRRWFQTGTIYYFKNNDIINLEINIQGDTNGK